ncbi:MAG: (d)CMP kinase [Endomicrobiales bacterium]
MKKHIVAIDGPAGAGKSTAAKMLARCLGYRYLDSGAMYRALTLKALQNGVDLRSEKETVKATQRTEITLTPGGRVLLDGKDVTRQIRSEEVSRNVSRLSRFSGVRKALRRRQRALARSGGVVMEGRDIGTAVFPDADFKFYLDASLETRALRRFREMKAKGEKVSLRGLTRSIAERDRRDRRRKESPLRRAKDALVVDSTGISPAAVVKTMREAVTAESNEKNPVKKRSRSDKKRRKT